MDEGDGAGRAAPRLETIKENLQGVPRRGPRYGDWAIPRGRCSTSSQVRDQRRGALHAEVLPHVSEVRGDASRVPFASWSLPRVTTTNTAVRRRGAIRLLKVPRAGLASADDAHGDLLRRSLLQLAGELLPLLAGEGILPQHHLAAGLKGEPPLPAVLLLEVRRSDRAPRHRERDRVRLGDEEPPSPDVERLLAGLALTEQMDDDGQDERHDEQPD